MGTWIQACCRVLNNPSVLKKRSLKPLKFQASELMETVGISRCQGSSTGCAGAGASLTAVFRVSLHHTPGSEPTLLSWTWVQLPRSIIRQQKRVRWTLFVVLVEHRGIEHSKWVWPILKTCIFQRLQRLKVLCQSKKCYQCYLLGTITGNPVLIFRTGFL